MASVPGKTSSKPGHTEQQYNTPPCSMIKRNPTTLISDQKTQQQNTPNVSSPAAVVNHKNPSIFLQNPSSPNKRTSLDQGNIHPEEIKVRKAELEQKLITSKGRVAYTYDLVWRPEADLCPKEFGERMQYMLIETRCLLEQVMHRISA